MQERFLSPRTMHFHSAELVWECNESLLCECGGLDERQDGSQQGNRPKSACADAFAGNKNADELRDLWFHLVTLYSRLKLTNESDRLPALSGLATRFGDLFKDIWLEGLWRQHLPRALLWQACPSLSGESSRTGLQQRIPTWSWASVQLYDTDFDGFITYDTATYFGFEPDHRLSILGASPVPGGLETNPFAHLAAGTIDIRGALISTILIHDYSLEYTSSLL